MAASPYRKSKAQGRTVAAHRLIWELAHGPIATGLIVHHRNGDKRDNRLANLELMTHQEHSAHHNTKHPLTKACEVCEATFTPHPTKRKRAKTCSRPCMRRLVSIKALEREAAKRASRTRD